MKKRKSALIFSLFVSAWIAFPLSGFAAAEMLPSGEPVDKVVCADDAEQSYALYLPAAYSSDRRWPIIYIFEPGARGPLAVGVFRAAAEKYGYILGLLEQLAQRPLGADQPRPAGRLERYPAALRH